MVEAPAVGPALAAALDAVLPQTQCTRCGYPDCRAYAEAIALDGAPIDRCPPGGAAGIARLAALTGFPVVPLDPACGVEAPRRLAVIDEAACIGCRLCLKACPVDAIVGGPKSMHTVIEADCTGCELCLPACPVDCIDLVAASTGAATGWSAWDARLAERARTRYRWRGERLAREADERQSRYAARRRPATDDSSSIPAAPGEPAASARSLLEQALERARTRSGGPA